MTQYDTTRHKKIIPNAKKFTSDYQPTPEAKSEGLKRRSLAQAMRATIEATVGEMLDNPAIKSENLLKYIGDFPKELGVADIISAQLLKDIANPSTKPEVRARLLDIYNKIAYGDKKAVDITTNGQEVKSISIESIIEEINDKWHNPKNSNKDKQK